VKPQEIARLLDEHGAALVLLARTVCKCPEDVVQEAFVELAKLRSGPENPAAWLFRSVRHRALNAARAARRRREHETNAAAESQRFFIATIDDKLDAAAAAQALTKLPEEERQIVVMKIWGGRSFAEIAEVLEIGVATAHRRYMAALEALREKMRLSCPNDPKKTT
jgi:RNA polymerase sigma-70 factor (ECF subfamily)